MECIAISPTSPRMEEELNLFDWYNILEKKIQSVIVQTAKGSLENFQNLMGLMLKGKNYDKTQLPIFKTFAESLASIPKDINSKLEIPAKTNKARLSITVPGRGTSQPRITRSVGSTGSARTRSTIVRSPSSLSSKPEKTQLLRSKSTNAASPNKSNSRIQKSATCKGDSLLKGTKNSASASISTPRNRHIPRTSSSSSNNSNRSSSVGSPVTPLTSPNGAKKTNELATTPREKWRPPSWYKTKLVDDGHFLEEKEAYRGELRLREADYREPIYNGDGIKFDPLPDRSRYRTNQKPQSKPRVEKIRSKSSANLKVSVKSTGSESCTLKIASVNGSEEGEEGAGNCTNNSDGGDEIKIWFNRANSAGNEQRSDDMDEGNKNNEQEKVNEDIALYIKVNEVTPGDDIDVIVNDAIDKSNDNNTKNEEDNSNNDDNIKNEDNNDKSENSNDQDEEDETNNNKNEDNIKSEEDRNDKNEDNNDTSENNETENVNCDNSVTQENIEPTSVADNSNNNENIEETSNNENTVTKKDDRSWIKYPSSTNNNVTTHKPRSQSVGVVQKLDMSQFQHLTKISISLTNSQRVVLQDKRDLDLAYRKHRIQRSASTEVSPLKEKTDSGVNNIEERLD